VQFGKTSYGAIRPTLEWCIAIWGQHAMSRPADEWRKIEVVHGGADRLFLLATRSPSRRRCAALEASVDQLGTMGAAGRARVVKCHDSVKEARKLLTAMITGWARSPVIHTDGRSLDDIGDDLHAERSEQYLRHGAPKACPNSSSPHAVSPPKPSTIARARSVHTVRDPITNWVFRMRAVWRPLHLSITDAPHLKMDACNVHCPCANSDATRNHDSAQEQQMARP